MGRNVGLLDFMKMKWNFDFGNQMKLKGTGNGWDSGRD